MKQVKILRRCDVLEKVGISPMTLWRRCKSGNFPKPFRLGGTKSRAVGWLLSDVENWIESQAKKAGKGND